MIYLTRAGLIIILPFLWVTLLIDIAFGDAITGCKTTKIQKLLEHKDNWVNLWKGEG